MNITNAFELLHEALYNNTAYSAAYFTKRIYHVEVEDLHIRVCCSDPDSTEFTLCKFSGDLVRVERTVFLPEVVRAAVEDSRNEIFPIFAGGFMPCFRMN